MTDRAFQGLLNLKPDEIAHLSHEKFLALATQVQTMLQRDRQEWQLRYYQPASAGAAKVHASQATWIGVSGGNGSSKTESCLVEIVALATGIFPESIAADLRPKFRGPVTCRVVVESLTNVLDTVILPKLIWNRWTGVDQPGGARGHWGWVPRGCLKGGMWDRSWSQKNRTLTFYCYDPDEPEKVLGESVIQFMSHDNDPEEFASGDFHHILLDEPPSFAVFRECQARTMRVSGRIYLAMTWPDDPAIPVDWIFDEMYEKGQPGPDKNPDYDWFELLTTDNAMLDQTAIRRQMQNWSEEMIAVRIEGKPIVFSNRVHADFTKVDRLWCFHCDKQVGAVKAPACPLCGSSEVVMFNHVVERHWLPEWPVYWCVDPHPRKPHFVAWIGVDPNDDLYWLATAEIKGDADAVYRECGRIEDDLNIANVVRWLGDPRMLGSPTPKPERNWEDEFRDAGFPIQKADPSEVGRHTLNAYLKPDEYLLRPRVQWHPRCIKAIYQFERFVWDEFKHGLDRDQKQKAKDKNDDYPAIGRYVINDQPSFAALIGHNRRLRRPGKRRGAYG